MTRCIPACVLAFGLAAVGVGAQTPPPEQKPADKPMADKSAQTVTIAGCVREGDTPSSFVLSNVDPSALRAGATGTTGTPSAPAASSAGMVTVPLAATSDIDLKKHVGHKVEVTGTIAKPEAGTSGTPAPEADKDKDKSKAATKLNVRSIKHVSESCSM